jgi:hypothetical protein
MINRRRWLLQSAQAAGLTAFAAGCAHLGRGGPIDLEEPALSTRIADHLMAWDAIELHRTGSVGEAASARWLAERARALGVRAEIDAFPFERRVPGDCYVSDGQRRAPGLPLFDGGRTGRDGVTGAAGPFGSGRAIGVGDFGPFDGHPSTQRLLAARRSDDHRALIAIAAGDGVAPGLAVLNAEQYAQPFGPPVLQVGTEHGEWLTQAAGAGATLTVAAPMSVERTVASNVQIRIPGRRRSLAPLVIMTPRSGWWTCTSERGGGIVVWLEALRRFAGARPDRPVVFTANTGHELGHVGLSRFMAMNPDLAVGAHAWVHLGANFAAAEGALRYQASDAELLELGLAALRAAGAPEPAITPLGQRPLGEARDVFDGGGRFASILGSNRLFHHPADRWPHAVDMDRTRRMTLALIDVIDQLARA